MSFITQRFSGTFLAATEENLFMLFSFIFYGRERCGFVRAVTEGLFVAKTALELKVGFTGFDFDHVGAVLGSCRYVHHILFALLLSYRSAGGALYERFSHRVTLCRVSQ